jgi:decaprenylphospho-beta-D-ribofuranose 2-oxidase
VTQTVITDRVVSFDGTEACRAEIVEPDRYRDLYAALEGTRYAIRGAGLSYCMASAVGHAPAVTTRHFDRFLAFDPDRRTVTVESGTTIGALSDFAVAHDCSFPVLPGHPAITVGGSAGFNVHGKTQHNVGHFSDHVEALTLFHPAHGELRCSAHERRDLFELTLGGMGLTGCIIDLTLRLQPLRGRLVRRRAIPVRSLGEAVARMKELSPDADALYSWNDLNARGSRFGQGVVYDERFEPGDRSDRTAYRTLAAERRGRLRVSAWSPLTSRAVNRAYTMRDAVRRETVTSVHDAAFPINGSEIYYELFGSRGLREYQVVLRHDVWDDAIVEIQRALDRVPDLAITLGSLKLFSGSRRHLWFRDDGICLTIDVPAAPAALELFARLDDIAVEYGATVNLSKDSRLTGPVVEKLFPELAGFRDALFAHDPDVRIDSVLRRRLGLS